MRKITFAVGASALVTFTAAMAQQPTGTPSRPNVVDMSGAPAAASVTGAKVLMLRTFVTDLDRSTKFYNDVFGMTAVSLPAFAGRQGATSGATSPKAGAGAQAAPARLTDGIRILNFPGGSPGMILIKGSGGPDMLRGSYIIQVPDLDAALAAAEANGGKVQATRFTAGAQESRHVLDPDGNDLEILQSGGRAKR